MKRSLRSVLSAAVFAIALSCAATAFAAPVAWQSVDVTLHSEQDGGVLVVAGHLPDTAKLPAEVELSVPEGSSLIWIGEILGGPMGDDPELQYTKTTSAGMDVYRATLTKARIGQIEVKAQPAATTDGTNYTATLKWASAQDVAQSTLAVRIPDTAQITQETSGATLFTGEAGYAYYAKTVERVKAGQALELVVAYTAAGSAAPVAAAATGTSGSNTTLLVTLVLALVVGVSLLVVAVAMRGRSSSTPSADDLEGPDPEDDPEPAGSAGGFDSEDDDEPTSEHAPVESVAISAGAKKRTMITTVIVVGLLATVVAVAWLASKPAVVGDTISQTFAGGEPCATAAIALAVPAGSDPSSTAEALFAALKPVSSVTAATYNIKTASIEVGFCESSTSESAIRTALAPTGLVASAGTTATPTP